VNVRFRVVTYHGESASVFHIVDSRAEEAQQPATMGTYSTYEFKGRAREFAEKRCAELNCKEGAECS
jgi:hypothetical protein